MDKMIDIMEDIKQKIADNEYKTVMDSLMEINKTPLVYENHKSNKFICLFQWLDTKIIITDDVNDYIKRSELYKFIIINFYNYNYYANTDFVKKSFKTIFYASNKRARQ